MLNTTLKTQIANIAVAAVAVYIALLACDVALYVISRMPKEPMGVPRGIYVADDKIGYRLKPSFHGFFNTPDGKFPVDINSSGFRGPEWSSSSNRRIVVLGDSFAFGYPLEWKDGLVAKIQKALPETSIYNLAVTGYGPPQIRETLQRECNHIKPDAVVYAFFLNDTSAWDLRPDHSTVVDGYHVPRREPDGRLLSDDEIRKRMDTVLHVPNAPLDLWGTFKLDRLRKLASTVELGQLLGRILHPTARNKPVYNYQNMIPHLPQTAMSGAPDAQFSSETVRKARNEIIQMQTVARDCGASFAMVILPSRYEAYLGISEPATDLLVRELGVDVSIFDVRKRVAKGTELSLWYDDHYSPEGTDVIAPILTSFIRGELLSGKAH